jgi:hypothetical protein
MGKVMPLGTDNGWAVLTDEDVVEIRSRYLGGNYSYPELARKFGVAKTTIQAVLTCVCWRWLLRENEEAELRAMREMRTERRR